MRYLEDLAVGENFNSPPVQVTEAEIVEFARRFDPQQMHLEVGTGIIASGWHTTAMVMRLIVEAAPFGGGPVLGLGVDELRWPRPVRPGDTISAGITIVSITPSTSKPTHGVVRVHVSATNQNGATVLSMFPNLWVPRRPASD
jgi:acyl dehydratase